MSHKPYGYVRLFSIPTSFLVAIVGVSSGYTSMTTQGADLLSKVGTSPSHFLEYGAPLVGYYLQGSLLLIWAAIGIYLSGTLLTQMLRGGPRAWRSVTMIVVLALLYLPVDQFSNYLVTGGASSSALLLIYVLVGLALVFGVVGILYSRLRSRPGVPTTALPAPSLPLREARQRDDYQDAQEDHQD